MALRCWIAASAFHEHGLHADDAGCADSGTDEGPGPTGALTMVQELFDTPGAGQDNQRFDFATDVDNTQTAEINIMKGMLKEKK